MKIAVSATGQTLDAAVDSRFGRCPCFLIVDPEDLTFQAVDNTSAGLGQGAGIQAARTVADQGVSAVLTGHCGPNAHETLSAAGISVIVGCAGTVRDAVAQYAAGALRPSNQPDVAGHTGTAGSPPPTVANPAPNVAPPGMGLGRGRGGAGRGMGQGMGQGRMGGGGGFGRGRGRGMGN